MENKWLNLMLLLKNDYDIENKLLMKEKELYDKFVTETNNESNTLSSKIKYDKLTYYFKSEDRIPISSNGCNPFNVFNGFIRKIKDGYIDLEKAKEDKE